jgi:hypothetical protein
VDRAAHRHESAPHLVRRGARITPLGKSEAALPPCDRTALELARDLIARKVGPARSAEALAAVERPDAQP